MPVNLVILVTSSAKIFYCFCQLQYNMWLFDPALNLYLDSIRLKYTIYIEVSIINVKNSILA